MGNRRDHRSMRLDVYSIRLMETSLNLEEVISAITALDILMSPGTPPSTYFHGEVISSLFNCILYDNVDTKFTPYTLETFKLFARNKQKMHIDLRTLAKYNEKDDWKLVNVIINRLRSFAWNAEYNMNIENVNMLKPELFNIFTNINDLVIEQSGGSPYFFSLFELLSLIQGTTVKTVKIKVWGPNWMEKLWKSSSGILVETFANKNFNLTMNEYYNVLTIKRS